MATFTNALAQRREVWPPTTQPAPTTVTTTPASTPAKEPARTPAATQTATTTHQSKAAEANSSCDIALDPEVIKHIQLVRDSASIYLTSTTSTTNLLGSRGVPQGIYTPELKDALAVRARMDPDTKNALKGMESLAIQQQIDRRLQYLMVKFMDRPELIDWTQEKLIAEGVLTLRDLETLERPQKALQEVLNQEETGLTVASGLDMLKGAALVGRPSWDFLKSRGGEFAAFTRANGVQVIDGFDLSKVDISKIESDPELRAALITFNPAFERDELVEEINNPFRKSPLLIGQMMVYPPRFRPVGLKASQTPVMVPLERYTRSYQAEIERLTQGMEEYEAYLSSSTALGGTAIPQANREFWMRTLIGENGNGAIPQLQNGYGFIEHIVETEDGLSIPFLEDLQRQMLKREIKNLGGVIRESKALPIKLGVASLAAVLTAGAASGGIVVAGGGAAAAGTAGATGAAGATTILSLGPLASKTLAASLVSGLALSAGEMTASSFFKSRANDSGFLCELGRAVQNRGADYLLYSSLGAWLGPYFGAIGRAAHAGSKGAAIGRVVSFGALGLFGVYTSYTAGTGALEAYRDRYVRAKNAAIAGNVELADAYRRSSNNRVADAASAFLTLAIPMGAVKIGSRTMVHTAPRSLPQAKTILVEKMGKEAADDIGRMASDAGLIKPHSEFLHDILSRLPAEILADKKRLNGIMEVLKSALASEEASLVFLRNLSDDALLRAFDNTSMRRAFKDLMGLQSRAFSTGQPMTAETMAKLFSQLDDDALHGLNRLLREANESLASNPSLSRDQVVREAAEKLLKARAKSQGRTLPQNIVERLLNCLK